MNEDDVLEWLDLGLGISDDLNNFRMDGKTLVQKTLEELTRGPQKVSMESALKIYKAIAKASERDMVSFDYDCTEISRKDEFQPIGYFFKEGHTDLKRIPEYIESMYSYDFCTQMEIRIALYGKSNKNPFSKYNVDTKETFLVRSFKYALTSPEHRLKLFKPFISRVPADFLRHKDFFVSLLKVMRKLPVIDEGSFSFLTKRSLDYFKVGEEYVFPSFTTDKHIGSTEKIPEDKTILRLSGRTTRGHKVEDGMSKPTNSQFAYFNTLFIRSFILGFYLFEPDTAFRVTKVENEGSKKIVYGEFIEGDPPIFENAVKKLEAGGSEPKEADSSETKYAEMSPVSLSYLFKLEKGYKGISLDDAVRNAGFENSENILTKAKEKENSLKRISKDFDLTEEDVKAIFIYTLEKREFGEGTPYCVVNTALSRRDEKDNLLKLREYIFYLLRALRHLPRFKKENVLYRGVNMSSAAAKDIYREGRTLSWTSFSSTTTDEEKAYEFVEGIEKRRKIEQGIKYVDCDGGIIFEIHGKFRGYSIGSLSSFGSEEEVLLEPDTKFTVMMVAQDEMNPTLLRIVLDVKETVPILQENLLKFEEGLEKLENIETNTNSNEGGEGKNTVPFSNSQAQPPHNIDTRPSFGNEILEEEEKEKDYQKQLREEYQDKYSQQITMKT